MSLETISPIGIDDTVLWSVCPLSACLSRSCIVLKRQKGVRTCRLYTDVLATVSNAYLIDDA